MWNSKIISQRLLLIFLTKQGLMDAHEAGGDLVRQLGIQQVIVRRANDRDLPRGERHRFLLSGAAWREFRICLFVTKEVNIDSISG